MFTLLGLIYTYSLQVGVKHLCTIKSSDPADHFSRSEDESEGQVKHVFTRKVH